MHTISAHLQPDGGYQCSKMLSVPPQSNKQSTNRSPGVLRCSNSMDHKLAPVDQDESVPELPLFLVLAIILLGWLLLNVRVCSLKEGLSPRVTGESVMVSDSGSMGV